MVFCIFEKNFSSNSLKKAYSSLTSQFFACEGFFTFEKKKVTTVCAKRICKIKILAPNLMLGLSTYVPLLFCRQGKDKLYKNEKAKHLLVLRNGNMYIFDCFDKDGRLFNC